MPIKATHPHEGAEDRFSFPHSTGPKTKLNEEKKKLLFLMQKSWVLFGNEIFPPPWGLSYHYGTVPSYPKWKKMGLCGEEPIQTAPGFYKREMF